MSFEHLTHPELSMPHSSSVTCQMDLPNLNIPALSWRRKWQSTPILVPVETHEWRSLAVYLQFMGSQRVWHDLATLPHLPCLHWEGYCWPVVTVRTVRQLDMSKKRVCVWWYGPWTGNQISCKQWRTLADKENQESAGWQETTYFGWWRSQRQTKNGEKKQVFPHLNVTFCSLCPQ